mmetsp:Transcript_7928/g.22709  ORF Transcript_7928/g.22709 Transcript_7928/m.22709 type:complete len:1117 (-) Transcript_7928:312-3662(-)
MKSEISMRAVSRMKMAVSRAKPSRKRQSSWQVAVMTTKQTLKNNIKELRSSRNSVVKGAQSSDRKFSMWTKKESMSDNSSYMRGRRLAGEAFVDIFAAMHPWAVKDFNLGVKSHHADQLGEAIELLVTCTTRPQILQHKLRVLALSHVQMGIKPGQIAAFGEVLFEVLEQVLGAYGVWDDEVQCAWHWMWDLVHKVFVRHMESAATMLDRLQTSWATIQQEQLELIIADKFYKHLFKVAPQLQPMFIKPFKMQLVMLSQALGLIVRCVKDTKVLAGELKGLAMTHIKYDISQVHLNIFGEILLATLKEVMGPMKWDDEMEAAWADIYMHISEVFGHVLSSGRNLVSKALADGDIGSMKKALQKMPRGMRARAALEIDVDDNIVSPIVWSIQDGQLGITQVLLQDVLTIRGDRDNYYYGRAMLWEKHPDLMRLLAEKAPSLIPAVLNGHMWTSRFIEDGHRRVNFYIKELYGDPSTPEHRNVYNTMLGTLVTKLSPSDLFIFAHPVVNFIVELKWGLFAKVNFYLSQFLNLANLALSTAYLQVGASHPVASFLLGLMQLLVGAFKVVLYVQTILGQTRHRNGDYKIILGRRVFIPYSVTDVFVILNMFSASMCVALFAYTWEVDPFGWRQALLADGPPPLNPSEDPSRFHSWADIAAFTTGLLWLQMAEGFKATTKLSALLYAFLAVLADVMRFMLVLLVWLLGFSITLYWLLVGMNLGEGMELQSALEPDLQIDHLEHANVGELIYFVMLSCLGLTSVDVFLTSSWVVRVVFATCVITTVVVLLNLLVSTMVNTYDMLQRNCDELAVKSRALLVVRAEERLTRGRRLRIFRGLGLDDPVDFEAQDSGPAGGLQVKLRTENMTHSAFSVLDRLERYSGPTGQDKPWEPAMKHLSPFSATVEGQGAAGQPGGAKQQTRDPEMAQQLGELHRELLAIKQKLGVEDNDQMSDTIPFAQEQPSSFQDETAPQVGSEPDIPIYLEIGSLPRASEGGGDNEERVRPRVVTMADLETHSSESSLWLLIDGTVYDCTTLLGYHPGGKQLLLSHAGGDSSNAFHSAHNGPSFTAASAHRKSLPVIGIMNMDIPGAIPAESSLTHLQTAGGGVQPSSIPDSSEAPPI